jgi:hypothetical protein
MELSDSPKQPPVALKPAAPEGARSGAAAAKKRSQPLRPSPLRSGRRQSWQQKACFLPRQSRWSNAKLSRWLGKSFAPVILSASCSRVPDKPNVGYFLCRPSISIDKLLKPLPMIASEETESSAYAFSRSKRMRKEDTGGGLGRAKEEDHASPVEAGEAVGGAAELER